MKFSFPVQKGIFLKRYKRFFADIEFEGEIITAHCPNTGSMKGCKDPGTPCLFSTNDDPKRKLKYTLEAVQAPSGSWVGVNTGHPNKLVWEAFQTGHFPHWKDFDGGQAEAKINDKSRMDLVLWKGELPVGKKYKAQILEHEACPQFHFVEVKNVTLASDKGFALFPDAVTERGQKHINELVELMNQGHTAEFVFIVQREDCHSFSPAEDIDPTYAKLLREAHKKGLQITAVSCQFEKDGLRLNPEPLELVL